MALTYQQLVSLEIAGARGITVAHVPPLDTYEPGNGAPSCGPMHRATLALTQGRNVRLARGELTQEEFGRPLKWDRTRVSKVEHGYNTLSPETIEALAAVTGRDPFWFYVPHADDENHARSA